MAIANFFRKINQHYRYSKKDIFQHRERWHCFQAHSSLSDPNAEELVKNLNSALERSRNFLQETTHLVLTLGSAWSYFHLESQRTVANCHQVPQYLFRKELQSSVQIQQALKNILKELEVLNPTLEVIFTISPVRHIRDGFVENQRSKAHLISAVHQVCEENNDVHYFPSYELVLDELRDYRFYAQDMLHPSEVTIDYIWKRFTQTWFSEASFAVLKEVEQIQKGLAHRPFNAESAAHHQFLKRLKERISKLEEQYPEIKF